MEKFITEYVQPQKVENQVSELFLKKFKEELIDRQRIINPKVFQKVPTKKIIKK